MGNLKLYPINDDLKSFWQEIYKKNIFKTWQNLELTNAGLNNAINSMSYEYIKNHIENFGDLSWLIELRGCELDIVEGDKDFHFDAPYSLVFAKFLMDFKRLPNQNEIWPFVQSINKISLEKNLDFNNKYSVASKTQSYFPDLNQDEITDKILKAAEYRCGKAFAALIREFYIISSLSIYMDDSSLYEDGFNVYWHPILDISGKIDAVIHLDDKKIGLAIFLDTFKSHENAQRKAEAIPESLKKNLNSIYCVPVKLNYSSNTIAVPTDDKIMSVRRAIGGNKVAQKNLQGFYRWERGY